MNQSPILVTGGCGFVGSAVLRCLLEQSERPIAVVDNLFSGKRNFVPESNRVTLHEVDLRDGGATREAIEKIRPSEVIHLAAVHFIPYCNQHPLEAIDINVRGTESLLQALSHCPPERLVAASTAAVYPIYDGMNREDSPTPEPTDIYGVTKMANEHQLAVFASKNETKCAAARLSNVYGPRETNPHVLPEIIDQMLEGKTSLALGNVKPKRDYIYVDDLARALVGLSQNVADSFRPFNVSTGVEYSVEDLVERLGEVAEMPLNIETDPNRVRKSDRPHLVLDNARLKETISWKPEYDLDRGLRELWQWSKENLSPSLADNEA